MKRRIGILLTTIVLIFTFSFAAHSKELETVNFKLNWIWNSTYTILMPGIYKGFFAEEGIKLNLLPGAGSVIAVQTVSAGAAEFGIASASVVLISKAKKETPIKLLGCINQRGMTAIFFSKNLGIKSAKDFEGKKIAGNITSLKGQAARIYFSLNKADLKKIKFVSVPKGQSLNWLLMGKTEAAVHAIINGRAKLHLKGWTDKYDYIYLEDEGVVLMELCFIVNERVFRERSDLVFRFMRAAMRSFRYAEAFPDEAKQMLLKHVSTLNKEHLEYCAEHSGFLKWSKETAGRPLGWISEKRLEMSIKTLKMAGKIPADKQFNLEEIYTNKYVVY